MKFVKVGTENWVEGKGYSKNLLLDSIDLISNKSLVQVIKIKAGDYVDNHYHKETTEIFYGLSGSGIFIINDKKFVFAKDDLLICEKGEVHATENPNNTDWIYLAVKTDNKEDTYWN